MTQSQKEQGRKFNTKQLEASWVEHFYESAWDVDTLELTEFETEVIKELTTFLPRHMEVYDWNLPYAEMIILIIRNLLTGKKLINNEESIKKWQDEMRRKINKE